MFGWTLFGTDSVLAFVFGCFAPAPKGVAVILVYQGTGKAPPPQPLPVRCSTGIFQSASAKRLMRCVASASLCNAGKASSVCWGPSQEACVAVGFCGVAEQHVGCPTMVRVFTTACGGRPAWFVQICNCTGSDHHSQAGSFKCTCTFSPSSYVRLPSTAARSALDQ